MRGGWVLWVLRSHMVIMGWCTDDAVPRRNSVDRSELSSNVGYGLACFYLIRVILS